MKLRYVGETKYGFKHGEVYKVFFRTRQVFNASIVKSVIDIILYNEIGEYISYKNFENFKNDWEDISSL